MNLWPASLAAVVLCCGSTVFATGENVDTWNAGVCSSKIDLTFVLDSSGSIGSTNWASTLAFVNRVIDSFAVGPSNTQVAVVLFSSTAQVQFKLNAFSSKAALQTAVTQAQYIGAGTDLAPGLQLLLSTIYTAGNGARSDASKLAIIITDGQFPDATGPAQQCKNAGIKLAAVGVGSGIDVTVLKALVSAQNYYFSASDYNGLSSLIATLSTEICPPDSCQSGVYCRNGGTPYPICVGGVTTYRCSCPANYCGDRCQNPGSACRPGLCNNGWCEDLQNGNSECHCQPGWTGTYCDTPARDYCNPNPCGTNGYCVNGANGYTCVCRAGYTGRNCDTWINSGPYDCAGSNPCTSANAARGLFYFPHYDRSKFVQCSEWGQCYVMPCPAGLVWDTAVLTCNWPNGRGPQDAKLPDTLDKVLRDFDY